jgi:hypothetical protein
MPRSAVPGSISVLKLFTPQSPAAFWLVGDRHQPWVAADGSGRADGSRHQRSFWRLWPTAKERWSDRAARVPQASAKKAELTSHKTNASQMNAETSQH